MNARTRLLVVELVRCKFNLARMDLYFIESTLQSYRIVVDRFFHSLWLEMKFPHGPNRRRLLEKLFADKVQVEEDVSAWPKIESATADFSGADLKRLVQDAKLRLAIDIARDRPIQKFEDYLFVSAAAIRDSRSAYAAASQRAMTANPNRPRWFNIHPELFENLNS